MNFGRTQAFSHSSEVLINRVGRFVKTRQNYGQQGLREEEVLELLCIEYKDEKILEIIV